MRKLKNDRHYPSRSQSLVLTLLVLCVGILSQSNRAAELLVLRDPPTRTDAALVFGGDPGYERTAHAVRLYKKGLVDRLVLCGGEPGGGDHASSLAKHAIATGVPADKLVLEDRSRSTHESVVFVLPILKSHKIRSLTLVTHPYHQRRAFLAARKSFGNQVTVFNSPAEPSFWKPEGWWRDSWSVRIVFSEYGKLAYYLSRGWI